MEWVLQEMDALDNWLRRLCASIQDDMQHPSHTVHVGLLVIGSAAQHKANLNVNGTAFFMLNDG